MRDVKPSRHRTSDCRHGAQPISCAHQMRAVMEQEGLVVFQTPTVGLTVRARVLVTFRHSLTSDLFSVDVQSEVPGGLAVPYPCTRPGDTQGGVAFGALLRVIGCVLAVLVCSHVEAR